MIKLYKKSIFTLVELLLVLAIVFIMTSMLLPSLRKAKEQASRIACISNQKQIATGIFMYANDNNELLPQTVVTGTWDDMNWIYQVKGYVSTSNTYFLDKKLDAVFACRSDKRQAARERFHYAYDSSYGFYPPLKNRKLSSLKKPSQVIMIGDYGESGPDTREDYYPGWLNIYSTTMHTTFASYHYPVYNGIMADGSGKTMKYTLVSTAAYAPSNLNYPLKFE